MEPRVVESIWDRLESSGLITPTELSQLQEAASPDLNDAQLADWLVRQNALTRYQADRLLEGRSRGFFYDHYKITDILGVGGMGSVFQAVDQRTGRDVALKVLKDHLRQDDGMQARFLQEARIGLRLNHPNIVRTIELGSAGGLPYMTMDFVPGLSLLEVLLRVPRVPVGQACDMIRQAALGLHYAHQAGLVHRDIKPQNLLIDRCGNVRVLDFGLAMRHEGEGGEEFSMAMIFGHECVGTAEYAAPEQTANSLAADARSDIYSLGATFFAALTGSTPFVASSSREMLEAHRSQKLRSVRELVPEIPEEVAAIVAKMLARNPEERYATAAEVVAALEPWSTHLPVNFNFESILAERHQQARARLRYLQKSQVANRLANSTARPAAASSIAQVQDVSREGVAHDPRSRVTPGLSIASPAPSRIIPVTKLVAAGSRESITLTGDRVMVGRGHDCQVRLEDPAVSSRHCELRFDGFHWWVTDLHSRNGTVVNNVPVTQCQLKTGDQIVLAGRVTFRFSFNEPEGKAAATMKPRFSRGVLLGALSFVTLAVMAALAWFLQV